MPRPEGYCHNSQCIWACASSYRVETLCLSEIPNLIQAANAMQRAVIAVLQLKRFPIADRNWASKSRQLLEDPRTEGFKCRLFKGTILALATDGWEARF